MIVWNKKKKNEKCSNLFTKYSLLNWSAKKLKNLSTFIELKRSVLKSLKDFPTAARFLCKKNKQQIHVKKHLF